MKRRSIAVAVVAAVLSVAVPSVASASPSPPGSNVPCTSPGKLPVILVHGTAENQFDNWQAMSPALKAAGYCVYSFDYGSYNGSGAAGIYGVGPIEKSAQELADFVTQVRQQTGASKVDLVGHSQGGMMPRYYIKNLGGGQYVDDLVGLSPSNHGTANPLSVPAGVVCPACSQQFIVSPFIIRLNLGDETPGDVSYTNVVTRYDEVVVPYTSGYLSGSNTTNITLQDKCPNDTSDHLRTPYDQAAIDITKNALNRNGPADPNVRPSCAAL